jgi:hypothetical protein
LANRAEVLVGWVTEVQFRTTPARTRGRQLGTGEEELSYPIERVFVLRRPVNRCVHDSSRLQITGSLSGLDSCGARVIEDDDALRSAWSCSGRTRKAASTRSAPPPPAS